VTIMENLLIEPHLLPAPHQPRWTDPSQLERVRRTLASQPALVRPADLRALQDQLAAVAAGRAMVVQCGDCAEDPAESTAGHVSRKAAVADLLARALQMITQRPVLRAGRIAGQFAKPRSRATEQIGGLQLTSYQGHMVNAPQPTLAARTPDPLRILAGYMAAGDIMNHLGWTGPTTHPPDRPPAHPRTGPPLWTSHEALLLDYEIPLLRRDEAGLLYLGSTHWPWVGERTRDLDGAHIALLARISNPVACKVGPTMRPGELLALCERLDPHRRPGRLTLITRMGADTITTRLPPLVRAVRAAGHPVTWLTDPLHGNTIQAPNGLKTRLLTTITREVAQFQRAVTHNGGTPGGLHLETTPDHVTECITHRRDVSRLGEHYTTLCDPRLNAQQALAVVKAWTPAPSPRPVPDTTPPVRQHDRP
jgi:3-deoxy-7-phosphoheptulonate synthase